MLSLETNSYHHAKSCVACGSEIPVRAKYIELARLEDINLLALCLGCASQAGDEANTFFDSYKEVACSVCHVKYPAWPTPQGLHVVEEHGSCSGGNAIIKV